jgi:ubiquitin C-terminal hydrolase
LKTFVRELANANSSFQLGRQADAHELFLFLIDEFFTANAQFTNCFEGTYESIVCCQTCQHRSLSSQNFLTLSVPVKPTIDEMIERWSSEEELEDPIECDACKKKQPSSKQIILKKLPEVLVFHLKRFTSTTKIYDEVALDMVITVKKQKYELYASCNHTGSLNFGHYSSTCKRKNGAFVVLNDTNANTVYTLPKSSSSPYLLFYRVIKAE